MRVLSAEIGSGRSGGRSFGACRWTSVRASTVVSGLRLLLRSLVAVEVVGLIRDVSAVVDALVRAELLITVAVGVQARVQRQCKFDNRSLGPTLRNKQKMHDRVTENPQRSCQHRQLSLCGLLLSTPLTLELM